MPFSHGVCVSKAAESAGLDIYKESECGISPHPPIYRPPVRGSHGYMRTHCAFPILIGSESTEKSNKSKANNTKQTDRQTDANTMPGHDVLIRSEQSGDIAGIRHVNTLAFPGGPEAELVDALRAHEPQPSPFVSLVALDGDRVVGHILFTPVTLERDQGDDGEVRTGEELATAAKPLPFHGHPYTHTHAHTHGRISPPSQARTHSL